VKTPNINNGKAKENTQEERPAKAGLEVGGSRQKLYRLNPEAQRSSSETILKQRRRS